MGIEPTQSAWKAEVLPLNYTRANYFAPIKDSCYLIEKAGGGGGIRTSEG